MVNTLEDVINVCKERYGLEVNNKNKDKYTQFLKRQLNAHIKYNINEKIPARDNPFPYFSLMVSKLKLFSYLVGETKITAGYEGYTRKKRINSVKDLYLLRPSELGGTISGSLKSHEQAVRRKSRNTDKKLCSLYTSFQNYIQKNKSINKQVWSNWGDAVEELGQDKEVVRYFGREIKYEMVLNCPSPNISSHGGDRRN